MAKRLSSDRLQFGISSSGKIVLKGPAIEEARDTIFHAENEVPTSEAYIELVSANENRTLALHPENIGISLDQIYLLGHSNVAGVIVVHIAWTHASIWRRKHKLGMKHDFHIRAYSTEVEHGRSPTLLFSTRSIQYAKLAQEFSQLGEQGLDHCFLALATSYNNDFSMQEAIAIELIRSFPTSFRGYLRLGTLHKRTKRKTALLCLLQAINLNAALVSNFESDIVSLSRYTTWGSIVEEGELTRENLDLELIQYLFSQPWQPHMYELFTHILWLYPITRRAKIFHQNEFLLPRFFSWLYPNKIAGMSHPKNEEVIDLLSTIGFTDVLTLSQESPINATWFKYKSINSLVIPIPNYCAPTMAEMDYVWSRIVAGGVWLIHCGGGVGRAGCVLACIIAMLGDGHSSTQTEQGVPCLDAQSAMNMLRIARPGSIETEEQERFVSAWISHRWKLRYVQPSDVLLSQEMALVAKARFSFDSITFLVLVGLPGSGKSYIAACIEKRRPRDTTIVISQDECGSRDACEAKIARNHKNGTLVILDRCNVTKADRRQWLTLYSVPNTLAVYLDYSVATCQKRIDMRFDHPTIRAGRGSTALTQMHEMLEIPDQEEGFAAIATITNCDAARQVIRCVGKDPLIAKFPRTPHLLDLGAATSDDIVKDTFTTINGNITVEEKMDGANMGFSLDYDGAIQCQNRGHYIDPSDHAQFKSLDAWLVRHSKTLYKLLYRDEQMPERFVLYGEWCAARHSISYTRLPDRFLVFDLYDRYEDSFVSRRVLTTLLSGTSMAQVPLLFEGKLLSKSDISALLNLTCTYGDELIEGVYVRLEDGARKRTLDRGKVVRGEFTNSISEHWTKRPMEYNGIVDQFPNG